MTRSLIISSSRAALEPRHLSAEAISRSMNGALIMSIAYGIHTLPSNDPYMETAEAAIDALAQAAVPGRYLVVLLRSPSAYIILTHGLTGRDPRLEVRSRLVHRCRVQAPSA
jgi:hypothetical protein